MFAKWYAELNIFSLTTFPPVSGEVVTEEKRKKTKNVLGTQSKAHAGWTKRLRLVQATLCADFAVITDQL